MAHILTKGANKMARQKKKMFNVYLTDEIMAFVREQAEKLDVPMTYYITGLIQAEKRNLQEHQKMFVVRKKRKSDNFTVLKLHNNT